MAKNASTWLVRRTSIKFLNTMRVELKAQLHAYTQPECAHSILEAQAANVGKLRNLVLTSSHTTKYAESVNWIFLVTHDQGNKVLTLVKALRSVAFIQCVIPKKPQAYLMQNVST